jgi:uncharacterized membrane protein YeaQ/YmgE (transglycosylase-associated protein family)
MNILGWFAWIIIGAVLGWLVNVMWKLKFQHNQLIHICVGMIGGFMGGVLFYRFGLPNSSNFNIWSLAFAFTGAAVLLGIVRLIPVAFRERAFNSYSKDSNNDPVK